MSWQLGARVGVAKGWEIWTDSWLWNIHPAELKAKGKGFTADWGINTQQGLQCSLASL